MTCTTSPAMEYTAPVSLPLALRDLPRALVRLEALLAVESRKCRHAGRPFDAPIEVPVTAAALPYPARRLQEAGANRPPLWQLGLGLSRRSRADGR